MGTDMLAFIEYDEAEYKWNRWESDREYLKKLPPPFGNIVTVQNLTAYSYSLHTGSKDYRFYGAVSGIRNETGIPPLFATRGLPENIHWSTDNDFPHSSGGAIGWLYLDEILAALRHQGITMEQLHTETLVLLDILEVLERRFGKNRVRLIFKIE